MPSYVDITCFECLEQVPLVDADAESFYCLSCDRQYQFLLCTACESVNQVRAKGHGGHAQCEWCWSEIRIRRLGRKDTATAADWQAELDERGLSRQSPDDVIIGGFRLLGGSGFDVETGAICSVLALPDAVDVRAEVGGVGVATIPYAEMTGLDIAGSTTAQGGGFIGGGLGLQGAAEGMLIASILNSITRTTSINTGLAIASSQGELLLNHGGISSGELRRQLSPLFTRFNAARQKTSGRVAPANDPAAQLERLAELRDKGLLTATEFEAARARVVKRLTEDAS